MFSSRLATLAHNSAVHTKSSYAAMTAISRQSKQAMQMTSVTMRSFATKKAVTKADKPKKHGVYLWAKLPRLGAKGGAVSTTLQMPKGMPQRIE